MSLILGVQMKAVMLIQHAEKKENWSSKRFEMSKWSFDNATLMTEILFTAKHWASALMNFLMTFN